MDLVVWNKIYWLIDFPLRYPPPGRPLHYTIKYIFTSNPGSNLNLSGVEKMSGESRHLLMSVSDICTDVHWSSSPSVTLSLTASYNPWCRLAHRHIRCPQLICRHRRHRLTSHRNVRPANQVTLLSRWSSPKPPRSLSVLTHFHISKLRWRYTLLWC